jgi:3-isopropylmalate/(R)-2-methylmalate dehydratase small subunit
LADIFFNNSFKNGLLPIALDAGDVDKLFTLVEQNSGIEFTVDLLAQTVTAGDESYAFAIDDFKKNCLLNGLDDIGLTLQHAEAIKAYEQNRQQTAPWLFPGK